MNGNSSMIQAIETLYAGCRFRSRLEARWAVFFDHLGIEWQYEPQGFETNYGRYLPDFRLSHVRRPRPTTNRIGALDYADRGHPLWIEIKGELPEDENAVLRPTSFANDLPSDERFAFLIGDIPRDAVTGDVWSKDIGGFVACDLFGEHNEILDLSVGRPGCRGIKWALETARSARFEHGESP